MLIAPLKSNTVLINAEFIEFIIHLISLPLNFCEVDKLLCTTENFDIGWASSFVIVSSRPHAALSVVFKSGKLPSPMCKFKILREEILHLVF